MPRARMIHPEFFSDGRIGKVSRGARLLFAAMWCYGDDAGLHPLDLARLRAEAFPHEKETTDHHVGDMLLELVEEDYRVVPYIIDGRTCLCVRNFIELQPIRYPSKAKCPLPSFVCETREDKPTRIVYRYALDAKALDAYLRGPVDKVVAGMWGTCASQVGDLYGTCASHEREMCRRTERSERTERRERKGLGLDHGAPTPPGRSKSSPVARDLLPNPETGTDQSCLDNPDSMFTRAVSGLEAATGSTLSPGVRHKLLAALQGFCGRLCLCHSLSHADRVTRVLPVCRKVADEAVSSLRGSEDWPSPDSLVVRYVEAIHTARKALMDEIIEAALPTESAHAKEG